MRDDILASPPARLRLANPNLPVLGGNEFDLGAGQQTEAVPHPFRNRHLTFAGDPHKVRVAPVLLLPRACLRAIAVPPERARQPLVELDLGAPAGERAQLRRVDVLTVDLA